MFVSGVRVGANAAQKYNETAPADEQTRAGDYIVKIIGQNGDATMFAKAIKASTTLVVVVHRPVIATHTIDKSLGMLGVDFSYAEASTSPPLIKQGLDGAVKKMGVDITGGDRILAVIGVRGVSPDLLKELTDAPKIELTISRMS